MKKFYLKSLFALFAIAACAFNVSADELTVCEPTTATPPTSNYLPINGTYVDEAGTTCQVIYPAEMLEDMADGEISAIKFYLNENGIRFRNCTLQFSVGETDQAEFGNLVEGLTSVASITFPSEASSDTELLIEFDAPFEYSGGNLVFESKVTTAGTWASTSFIGVATGSNTGISRGSAYEFLPKATFTYEVEAVDYKAIVSPQSLNFGKVVMGGDNDLTVTIKNKGTNAFTPTLSNLDAPFTAALAIEGELAPGDDVNVNVTFAPTEYGNFDGTLTIDCGEAGTFDVTLNGLCANEVDIADGNATNSDVPIYGLYCDTQGTRCQVIYPADMLIDLVGKKINSVTFYPNNGSMALRNVTLQVSIGSTTQIEFDRETAIAEPNFVTDIANNSTTAVLVGGEEVLEFNFAEPFEYNGDNLVIETLVTVKGNYATTPFKGTAMDYNAGARNSSNGSALCQFLPKATFSVTDPDVVTGIDDAFTGKPIKGVRYYNLSGVASTTPFEGFNIVVTEYTDGTKSSTKVIK